MLRKTTKERSVSEPIPRTAPLAIHTADIGLFSEAQFLSAGAQAQQQVVPAAPPSSPQSPAVAATLPIAAPAFPPAAPPAFLPAGPGFMPMANANIGAALFGTNPFGLDDLGHELLAAIDPVRAHDERSRKRREEEKSARSLANPNPSTKRTLFSLE